MVRRNGGIERMKSSLAIAATMLLTIALGVSGVAAGVAETGNGAPSGAHYNLNLIGVTNPKNMPENLDSGHVIFVNLNRDGTMVRTNIGLTAGDFQVLDKDGTDGNAAFALPYPLTAEEDACYEIYARALGKPGGSADITTCLYDEVTGTFCDTGNTVTIKRPTDKNGPVKFAKVTSALTTITTIDGKIPIFSDPLDSYWWQYDNSGLRLAQLRFYYTGTCTAAPTA